MGVPKFYRWISERYPKINQIISDSTLLPEFDNLYLDMNGILHTCTHPNDDGLSVQLSERDIILGIFHYIDRIVTHIVRPRRVLYMAIDGVAPRAKMNQQRSRRFRARKDMKEAKLIAESKGEVVDDEAVFDSNCITPGTEFMAKISRHLRYFIQKKITEDPLWKALTVTFSGHEVPGEGEHKIMAYIRDERSAGRLPPNTRHCMYGQDADLILLGLVTHEPHFTLLREVVNFGKSSSKGKNSSKVVVKTTRDAQFQLLHLSVLREYIWAEFTRDLPQQTEAEMDRERVVDDFIFLTFLVGNDFLPHMPSLDIGEEAFSLLFQIYRSLKPGWGGTGYLTKEGAIDNPERLEQFLREVGSKEDEIFSERAVEEAEFRGRRRRTSQRFGGSAEEIPSEAELAQREQDLQHTYENAMIQFMGYVPEAQDGEKDYKGRYYFEKFGISPLHTDVHDRLRAAYVEGLIWCLAYYYRGCVSWGWFFPFHYVPMISDLKGLKKVMENVSFDLGEPFLPFEQLLGCLPGASAGFLPSPHARLMTSPESPIIDFYPEDFEVDMNGKRNPWEAVNVLPFIDAYRLRAAVAELCPPSALSPEEADRNTMGEVLEYRHDPTLCRQETSCNPEIGLADIRYCSAAFRTVLHHRASPEFIGPCNCVSMTFTTESKSSRAAPFSIKPGECFKPELPRDTVIPTAGFPSLHVLSVGSVEEQKVPVNVFGSGSRYETLVLQLKRPPVLPSAASLASKVLGRSAFLNWPLMHEARVVGISDQHEEYRLREVRGSNRRRTDVRTFSSEEATEWRRKAAEEQGAYLTGRGVPGSGGVDIGKVQLMLKARPLQGMRVDPATGARQKVFGKEEAEVPVYMVLWSCPSEDPRFHERESATVEERFPVGSRVMCLHGGKGHGCGGEVLGHEGNKVDVLVDVRPPEPPFGLVVVQSVTTRYVSKQRACEVLGVKPHVFGRVIGSVFVEPGKLDLGLNLKQNGRYQLLGYSRCILRKEAAWSTPDTVKVVGSAPEAENVEESSWEFSAEAVRLIFRYMQSFPQLFHGLARRGGGERHLDANALLGQGGKRKAEEIAHWLSEIETAGLQRVPLTTKALSREAVKAVERGADVRQAVMLKNSMIKKTTIRGLEPSQLLAYDVAEHTDAPMDTGVEKPDLGDRVVNMRAKGVPFGLWGTVVASHSHSSCVEVVFDEEFIGGTTLHGMCSNYRGALVPWATVAKIHTRSRLEALRASGASHQAGAGIPVAAPAKSRHGVTRQTELSAPAAKRAASDFRLPPNEQYPLQHPSANGPSSSSSSRGRDILSSTEALKGALGIKLKEEPAVVAAAAAATAVAVVVSRDGTSETETTAAAAARLKGMLGVGAPNKSRAGSTRTAEAGIRLKRTGVPVSAVSVSDIEHPRTAGTEKATAELKAMIGVGGGGGDGGGGGGGGNKRSPEILGGDDERRVADGGDGGSSTRGTPSRQREMLPQGVLSPEGSERRGQANLFRQAKGPDKVGTGFKVSRASRVSAAASSDTTPPPPDGPPSTQPSSAVVAAAAGDRQSGIRDNRGATVVPRYNTVPVKGGTERADDATRSRVIRAQEQALADANARHLAAAAAKGGQQETTPSTTLASPVPSSAASSKAVPPKESPALTAAPASAPAAKRVTYNAEPKGSETVLPSDTLPVGETFAPSPSSLRHHQQHASGRPSGVPVPVAFPPSVPGMEMGGVPVASSLSHPTPPWSDAEESAQRVLWQQQRMFEGFQIQQQHQRQQQQQGHQVLLQQLQYYPTGRGGPVYPQAGAYPGAAQLNVPGVPFVQQPQPYQRYGYPQEMVPPHPHSQAFGGYPHPRPSALFAAPAPAQAQVPTPADPSKTVRRKPRKASLMIPSSALLAGSRRPSKASRDGGQEEEDGGGDTGSQR